MNRKQVGKNIRNRRKELKMTQADLADKAHFSVIHVSHIENGTVNMSLEALLAICHALHITPNDILLGEYLYNSVEDMVFREPSNHLNYDDKILLQRIFGFMEERRTKEDNS